MTNKYTDIICRAIMARTLPDEALGWPIITVSQNSVIYGSGESAQFGTSNTLRINGKQVERKHSQYSEYAQVSLPERCVLAGKVGNVNVYVQRPT